MTNKDFEMIVKNTIPEDIFCNLKKVKYSICPDEYVGKVSNKEWIRMDISSSDLVSFFWDLGSTFASGFNLVVSLGFTGTIFILTVGKVEDFYEKSELFHITAECQWGHS